MKFDEKKAKITHASDGCKFLGFEIRLNIKKPKVTFVTQKNKQGKYVRFLQRTTSRQLTIETDSGKILQKIKTAAKEINKT